MRKIKLGNTNNIKLLFGVLIIFILFFTSYVIANYVYFDPSKIRFETSSVKIFDENNTLLWEISKDNAVKNTPVTISDVPLDCKNALIAIEDRTFKSNIGLDFKGLGRLTISFFSNGSLGGGSTISQQVIKNYYNNIYNRSAVDKLKEIIYAVKLNSYYSKDQILEMYLNNVYFGDLNYGLGSASENYFGKKVQDLNLSECAYLAGIPQWPGVYSPNGNLEKGKKRQAQVLQAMLEEKYITYQESIDAYSQNLEFNLQPIEVRAPHFIQFVQDTLNSSSGNNTSDNSLSTTYNYKMHSDILSLIQNNIKIANLTKLNNGAVVIFNKNELKVMIGSQNYFDDSINGKFNSALGLRQPGSSLGPLFKYFQLEVKGSNNELSDLDIYTNFEEYLRALTTVPASNLCNENLLNEGCEVSIYDLSKIYHLFLNGYSSSFIKTDVQVVDFKNSEFEKYFNQNAITYDNFKILLGDTSNMKDIFAIATNGEYTIGIWLGNTDGDPIDGLSAGKFALPTAQNIIDYILKNER